MSRLLPQARTLGALALLVGLGTTAAPGAPLQLDRVRAVLLDPDHPTWSTRAPERFRVALDTSAGEVVLELFRRWSPHGVDRLYNLARLGYFDDSRVHRVREGAFAQFGLAGEPAVSAAWYGRTIPDDPRVRRNRRGAVSFAMLEAPDSRTTQLFVNLRDNPEYDAQGFIPIGRVVAGMEAVDSFYAGYGDEAGGGMRAGRQGPIVAEGNAWLDARFPELTRIRRASILPGEVLRYPDLGANRIRAEVHMLPAVSTGPLDPAWSPDGSRLAFAMAGDIWLIDAAGGTATALTAGPGYHSEPAWSPDGSWIAFSRDLDGNLDIGMVPAAGGDTRLLTRDPHVDVQPAWGADSATLYWASARGGSFDIYRLAIDTDAAAPVEVIAGPGHQIQPAVSPAGGRLAFVAPVAGRIGTGGLWTLDLTDPDAAAELVHYEETSFRAEPRWSADGASLVFVSDEAGSNDIATVPASGGSKARLTEDSGGELDPAPGPDGSRIAFVSNRGGPTRLMLAPSGGGRRAGWREVRIEGRQEPWPVAELSIRVRAADTDDPVPARLHVLASDGRGHAPEAAFQRVISATDLPYFHADDEVTLRLPAGPVEVEARRGPEFHPAYTRLVLEPGERRELTLTPARLVDLPARGWVSGDTHSHDLHQGRYGLSHRDYFRQLLAEDLRVTHALIHMDGTRLMGRWDDLTGEPHPLSTPTHVLQYGQEFRGAFGHVGLLGISEFVMPLIGGAGGTAFAADVLNADWLDAARAQGGIGGYMHPYSRNQDPAGSEIALDVALGKGDFYDVVNYPYDDLLNAAMYRRFLNAGFRLPATGGSDNFADVWRDAPPGSARTYAHTGGRIDVPAWLAAVRAGRTFATNGPLLLLRLAPAGPDGESMGALAAGPGEELAVGPDAATRFVATVEVASVAPLERLELRVNGVAVQSFDVRERGERFVIEQELDIPGSAWVAAMAVGPAARAVTDGYPFAHTTPVWVVRGGVGFADPDSARELAEIVRAFGARVARRDRFTDAAARARFEAAVAEAIAVYERIARTGRPVAPRR